jgi:hypothetical protein
LQRVTHTFTEMMSAAETALPVRIIRSAHGEKRSKINCPAEKAGPFLYLRLQSFTKSAKV